MVTIKKYLSYVAGLDLNNNEASVNKILQYALDYGVLYNDYIIFITLVNSGINLAACDAANKTILHYACEKNSLYAVAVLLQHGANANALDVNNKTPLAYVQDDNNKIITLINTIQHELNYESILDFKYKGGANLLMMSAIVGGCIKSATALCEAGVNVNTVNPITGCTALQYAAYRNRDKLANLLCNHGADKNLRDNKDLSAIDYAKLSNSSNVLKILRGN